ncbi:hypothetical protein OBBRIDRAFT_15612 [Obba rivulosa]|uniref:Uncharacterized protein n=1 Tax=Obba rivulosa TaxID=1052685 RepID=A0A8E2DVV7_9APHY|nr:hypothetical protein OBBRIDRAFT_15612 [Obba rivulosa]
MLTYPLHSTVPSSLAFLPPSASQSVMTAMHDARSIESQKERYSRELAAYTLRQWSSAYQTVEAASNQTKDDKSSKSRSSSINRDSGVQNEDDHNPLHAGIQFADYAQRSRNVGNVIDV